MKIFEVAEGRDSKGNQKAVSLKVVDFQGDLDGESEIITKYVTIRTKGGYNQSRAIKEHWSGAAEVGRAVVQPAIIAPVTGGIIGGLIP